MNIRPITVDYLPILENNYIWLIINSARDTVIAVDPGDAEPLIDFLNAHHMTLGAVLITHHHRDHTNGIQALKKHTHFAVYGPINERIEGVTEYVEEGSCIQPPFLNASLSVIDIPGHTLGHVAYYVPGFLFCGDTLFSAGCGRLFEGTAVQMYHSLQKITGFPDDTKLYCSHEYTLQNLKFAQQVEPHNLDIQEKIHRVLALRQANIPSLPARLGEEKKINPFLRCHVSEVVLSAEKRASAKLNSPIEVFKTLRKWKDEFRDVEIP